MILLCCLIGILLVVLFCLYINSVRLRYVLITDLWTDHTPWSFNQLHRSYNFMVKHGILWKMTYYGTAPRVIYQSNLLLFPHLLPGEMLRSFGWFIESLTLCCSYYTNVNVPKRLREKEEVYVYVIWLVCIA